MEPKWRDMCQIELSASTNRGWERGGGENPLTLPRNLARERLHRAFGDIWTFSGASEHALLKIHKKAAQRAVLHPPHLMYVFMHVRLASVRLPICLVQVSHLAFIARIPGAAFYYAAPPTVSLSQNSRGGTPRPRRSSRRGQVVRSLKVC